MLYFCKWRALSNHSNRSKIPQFWRRDWIFPTALMATFGKVDEFDASKEEWAQYEERLTQFFLANDIDGAAKKRAVLLSVIGPTAYKVLRSLLAPVKPSEKDYDDLVAKLSQHYSPTPSEIVQRFKFHSRFRKPGESVATYVSELRSLAEYSRIL